MKRLQPGMSLYHKFKDMVGGKEAGFDWTATVVEIDEPNNNIVMDLQGSGGQWRENWDYAITVHALWDGEYRLVNKNMESENDA